jgi:hypothetical protein
MMGSVASALIAVSVIGLAPQLGPVPTPWESDYGRALAATRQAKERPLLVVLDKPADSQHRIEPVRLVLEQSVNRDAALLTAYALCHVDVSTEYGQKVAKAFKATAFPFLAIIDKSGRKIIHQTSGPLTDEKWQSLLAAYKTGEIPQQAPVSFLQEYVPYSSCPSCQRGW